jgi:hypothetical protein
MFVGGIILNVISPSLPWELLNHLLRDFSIALFVAALLAISVDRFFRTEFAKDVFNAAYSYLLPDELKQEIKRIIETKFVCVRHYMVLELKPIGNGLFRLEISIERTIKNISAYKQEINASFATDEWGFPVKSEIKTAFMRFGGKDYPASKSRGDLSADAIGFESESEFINHNEEVQFVFRAHEIKMDNAEYLINFRHPTNNPIAEIRLPEGFSHSFGFGIPGGGDMSKSSLFERYELNGTQFPGQFMRLRWWPTPAANSGEDHRGTQAALHRHASGTAGRNQSA